MMVRDLAMLVRRETEAWARAEGYCAATLEKQCAVASQAFVAAARAVGVEAELIFGCFAGTDPPDPHFWAFAWENRQRLLVDLTATQYFDDAPPAAVFSVADPPIALYFLACAGDEAREQIRAQDVVEGADLTARVLPLLRRSAA